MARLRPAPRRSPSRVLALATVGFALAAAPKAQAQTPYVWMGGVGDNWSLSNWYTPNLTNGYNQPLPRSTPLDLYFGYYGTDGNGKIVNDLSPSALQLHGLLFATQSWTLTGNRLNFVGNDHITVEGTSTSVRIDNDASFDGSLLLNVGTRLDMRGVLSGLGTIVKAGTGTVDLFGTNTYQGGTTIAGGTIRANANDVLGVGMEELGQIQGTHIGDLRLVGGTLDLNGYRTGAMNLVLGDGAAKNVGTITGGGALKLFGDVKLNGRSDLTTGTVTLGSDILLSQGTHTIDDNGSLSSAPYTMILAGGISALYPEHFGAFGASLSIAGKGTYLLTGHSTDLTGTFLNAPQVYLGVENALTARTGLQIGSNTLLGLYAPYDAPGVVAGVGRNQTIRGLGGAGKIELYGATLTVGSGTYGGTIQSKIGGGALVKNTDDFYTNGGILELTGDHSQAQTTVNGGRLIDHRPKGAYTTNGSGVLEFSLDADAMYNQSIGGTGAFAKSGTGLLSLGSNAYTGGTTILGGGIRAIANDAIGSGDLTLNGGSFDLNGRTASVKNLNFGLTYQTISKLATGVGNVLGAGTLNLNGNVTARFDNSLANDSVTIAPNIVLSEGTHTFSTTGPAYPVTVSGTISGLGGLDKASEGTLTLTGHSTYTGGTKVRGGGLYLGATDALPTNTALSVTGSGRLVLNGYSQTVGSLTGDGTVDLGAQTLTVGNAASTTFAGTIDPNATLGSLVKKGAGTLELTGAHGQGQTTVDEGRLIDHRPNGAYSTNGNGVLEFRPDVDTAYGGSIDGTGSFVKSGLKTLTLSGQTGYAGSTRVSLGSLKNGVENALPTATALTVDLGGFYDLGGYKQTVGSLSGAGGVALGAGTLTVDPAAGTSSTFSGVLAGAGSLVKTGSGTLTLSGTNAFSGGATVKAGILRAGADGALGFGNLTLAGGTLDLGDFRVGVKDLTLGDGLATNVGAVTGGGWIDLIGDLKLALRSDGTSAPAVISPTISLAPGQHRFGGSGSSNTSYDAILSGMIRGTGGLTLDEGKTLVLAGFGAYSGPTDLKSGRLVAGGNNAFSSSSDVTIARGASMILAPTTTAGGVTAGAYDQTVNSISGEGSIVLGSAGLFVGVGDRITQDTTFSGSITGIGGSLIKNGLGTLTLAGDHDYTGGTQVKWGRLIDLKPNGDYLFYTTLEFALDGDLAFHSLLSGGYVRNDESAFVKSGAGNLTLFRANSYEAATQLLGGTITNGVDNALPQLTALSVGAGTFYDLAGHTQTVGSLAGVGTVRLNGATLTVNPAQGVSTTFGGVIEGGSAGLGAFVKSNAGALVLNGRGAYSGGTTVNGGRLVLGGDDVLPSGRALRVDGDGIVDLGSHTQRLNALTGTGRVALAGGLLDVAQADDLTYGGALSGSGAFRKGGAGTLTLTGAVDSGVGVTLNGGRLKVATNGYQAGTTSLASGTTLQFDLATKSATYLGTIDGAGGLLKTGGKGLTLAHAPGNAGGVRVSGGSLVVNEGGAFGGGLTVDSSASFANPSGDTLTIGGRTVTQGEIATLGGSTTVFTGLVSGAGGFSGFGTVDFEGGYSPGNSPAAVKFQGDLVLGAANALTMELGGTTLGADYDHLTVDGTAFLGGALNVAWTGGFTASAGQSFDLFDFQRSNGTFASLNLPTLSNGLVWNTSGLYTNGVLRTQAVPEPASLAALGLGGLAFLRRRKR